MKVEKMAVFAPITVTIESERDLHGLKAIVENYVKDVGIPGSVDYNVASFLLKELQRAS
jgi:hypothetical protein